MQEIKKGQGVDSFFVRSTVIKGDLFSLVVVVVRRPCNDVFLFKCPPNEILCISFNLLALSSLMLKCPRSNVLNYQMKHLKTIQN